ncbi:MULTISPECIES: hypothetical protein [unclassified Thiocapsa]|uniref:hypothetical protein n=1 Tax=unclassified Thiocapsa TaxID=2641286 RepID=UPI0035B3EFF3
MMHPNEDPTPSLPATDDPAPDMTDPERRAALAKLGALAAWTAPTMLSLVATPRSAAASPL